MLFNLNSKEKTLLFLGDILFVGAAIYLSYVIRYFGIPDILQILTFLTPFTYVIILWFVVFFISGMYDDQTLNLQKKNSSIIINSQIVNLLLTAIYFYLFSAHLDQATPKTILLIYIVISTVLLLSWRLFLYKNISKPKRNKALLIGTGEECEELKNEINNNNRYPFYFEKVIDSKAEIHDLDNSFNFASFDVIVVDKAYIKNNKNISEFFYNDLF
ncbi:hypothetical protein H7X65_02440 [Candidatus Parcubacteria bacterium]|nr:hypothetical protein [Candidatus Parcubacteria bacterium]